MGMLASEVDRVRALLSSQLLALLLLIATAAGAQVPPGSPPGNTAQAADTGAAQATPATSPQEVTVTAPRVEPPLPSLAPGEFSNCYGLVGSEQMDYTQAAVCQLQLAREKRVVIETCINRGNNTPLPRVVEACTEALNHKIFDGDANFFLFADRAAAYFAQGDLSRALDDFDEAIKLAPRNADLYYNRGVFYAAQPDNNAALRDLTAALSINPKHLAALRKRARIYQIQGNLSAARADYSEAISLQPQAADLRNERACVYLLQGEFQNAVADETQAIQFNPNLARAYYFRSAAFAGLGKLQDAHSDLATAVHLDPSLERYVQDKSLLATHAP
jgi:tetratricopeptide (TPR) repeat protein